MLHGIPFIHPEKSPAMREFSAKPTGFRDGPIIIVAASASHR
jgi:hypothetical protein